MALINCRECGKSISSEAHACPHCGCPVKRGASEMEMVPVNFSRNGFFYPQVNGTVYIDGQMVGSAKVGTDFTIRLSPGQHTIVIESTDNHRRGARNTESCDLEILEKMQSVHVQLGISEGLLNWLVGTGKRIAVKEITTR